MSRKADYKYSRFDRTRDYLALFLIGLIGWTCDRLYSTSIPSMKSSAGSHASLPDA